MSGFECRQYRQPILNAQFQRSYCLLVFVKINIRQLTLSGECNVRNITLSESHSTASGAQIDLYHLSIFQNFLTNAQRSMRTRFIWFQSVFEHRSLLFCRLARGSGFQAVLVILNILLVRIYFHYCNTCLTQFTLPLKRRQIFSFV